MRISPGAVRYLKEGENTHIVAIVVAKNNMAITSDVQIGGSVAVKDINEIRKYIEVPVSRI